MTKHVLTMFYNSMHIHYILEASNDDEADEIDENDFNSVSVKQVGET